MWTGSGLLVAAGETAELGGVTTSEATGALSAGDAVVVATDAISPVPGGGLCLAYTNAKAVADAATTPSTAIRIRLRGAHAGL
jgi:hypothetical protein